MTKTLKMKMEIISDYEKIIFWSITSCILVVMVSYVSFMMSAFLGGVERKELVKRMDVISTNVEQLETKYLASQKKIDVAFATEQGFVVNTDTKFVSLISESTNLSLNKF